MVYIVEVDGLKYYACEVCGLLYDVEELAIKCEEHCRAQPGFCNVELAERSVGFIDLGRRLQKVYFKVSMAKRCGRLTFRFCKASVNVYKAF